MPPRKDGIATKERILDAACRIFSERGFHDATHAQICKLAAVNSAAINYHFRDKQTLYVEAWRLAFHRSLQAHPADGGVPADAPAEDRLQGRVLSIIERMVDPKSYEFEIVHKEHANPTGLLAKVMHESIQAIMQQMGLIVRELLGDLATGTQVELCQMSIIAQCFHIMTHRHLRKMFSKAELAAGPPPFDFTVKVMADHIVRFSLAGIREMRRQIDNAHLPDSE